MTKAELSRAGSGKTRNENRAIFSGNRARGIRRLVKKVPGAPTPAMKIGQPPYGKRGIRRFIKRDPADGRSQPTANAYTSTHVAVGPGSFGARVMRKANASTVRSLSTAGRRVIRPARVVVRKGRGWGQK